MAEIVLAREVVDELREAFLWYEERRVGLGHELLNCMDDCIAMIRKNPEAYAIAFDGFRRVLVPRFPYAVFYEVRSQQITIMGIMHTARNPDAWRANLHRRRKSS